MKNLDMDTVLEIIKMIDRRVFILNMECNQKDLEYEKLKHFEGYISALEDISEHLQEYIEGQLRQVEQ